MDRRRWFSGSAALGSLCLATLLTVLAAPAAQAREVVVQNDMDEAIYKLFVWPSELVPRTYSVLPSPLPPKGRKTVSVDDVYGDCLFTFQADLTKPKGRRMPLRRVTKKPRPRIITIERVNLCLKLDPVEFE